jgi:hypothetical protein
LKITTFVISLLAVILLVPNVAMNASAASNSTGVQVTNPQEQIDERRGMQEDESIISLNITYWNKTQAIVNGSILNFEASDEIVRYINSLLNSNSTNSTSESGLTAYDLWDPCITDCPGD